MSVNLLRLKLTLPNAHFRVIHSNDPRKTYPVPPYSTVIGFLANILGNREHIETMIAGDLALGVLSKFSCVVREYTWMRNLLANEHKKRYGSVYNRKWQGVVEHIGGQSPVNIETLNDVEIVIYVYHSNPAVLAVLQENIVCPERWFSHLHLGRAEDWAMVDSIAEVTLLVSANPADLRNADQYYQWMPEPTAAFGLGEQVKEETYRELYHKTQGPIMLVTTEYSRVRIPYEGEQGGIVRNFQHVPARLCCAAVPFLSDFTLPALLVDPELGAPIYMARVLNNNGSGKEVSCYEE